MRVVFLPLVVVLTVFSGFIQAASLVDEVAEIYFSSEKGFSRALEMYGVSTEAESLQVTKVEGFVHPGSGYYVEEVSLRGENTSEFKIHIRFPDQQKTKRSLPVIFVMAGLNSSAETLNLLPRRDDVVFVVFEYSVAKQDPLQMASDTLPALEKLPSQVPAALSWLSNQPWTDRYQLHVVGVSLGTLMLPLSLRIAQTQGTYVDSVVLSYGGADLSLLVDAELQGKVGHREREILVEVLQVGLKSVDPTLHLPYLRGKFLVVYGEDDRLIPWASTQALIALTPEPKEIKTLPGGHIQVDKWEILSQFGNTLIEWYKKLGTIKGD